MRPGKSLPPLLRSGKSMHAGFAVGGAALLLGVTHAMLAGPQTVLIALHTAFFAWLGIAAGSLPLLMVTHLVDARWCRVLQRPLEAAVRTIWLFGLIFVLIFLGSRYLFPWTDPELLTHPLLAHRTAWLNLPFFGLRAVAYFFIWSLLARLLTNDVRDDEPVSSHTAARLRLISKIGLGVYLLTATFAAWDWIIGLDPHWSLAMWAFNLVIGHSYLAVAAMAGVAVLIASTGAWGALDSDRIYRDLANVLLFFAAGWMYLHFSQHLIVWSGNLPHKIEWYIPRFQTSWIVLPIVVTAIQLSLPFALLLSHWLEFKRLIIGGVAGAVVLSRLIEMHWIVAPHFRPAGLATHWLDIVIPIGVGALWLALFLQQLNQAAVLPPRSEIPEGSAGLPPAVREGEAV
jgi:hypothetical protein